MPIKKQINLAVRIAAGVALLLATGCGSSQEESVPLFQVGRGGPNCPLGDIACGVGNLGHEVLTIEAILAANERLIRVTPIVPIWDNSGDINTSGAFSPNRIVRGNFATDKPISIQEFDIRGFQRQVFGVDENEAWHTGGNRQVFHALRNYIADIDTEVVTENPRTYSIQSAVETCEGLQSLIKKTSARVVEASRGGPVQWHRDHLIGSVTHTIQDSFSSAHAQRDNGGNIVDFCKYGDREIHDICYHDKIDATLGADRIFSAIGWPARIKPEARMAIDTTTTYLVHMTRVIHQGKSLDAELDDFFHGSPTLRNESYMQGIGVTGTFTCNLARSRPLPN